jgi:hypothetical protein
MPGQGAEVRNAGRGLAAHVRCARAGPGAGDRPGAATLTPSDLEVNAIVATEGSPSDHKVVACAVEGQAEYVIASDEHLLKLERYANVVIVPPRRFLDLLEETQQGDT